MKLKNTADAVLLRDIIADVINSIDCENMAGACDTCPMVDFCGLVPSAQ